MGAEVGGKMRDDGDRTRGPNRKGVRGGGGGGRDSARPPAQQSQAGPK